MYALFEIYLGHSSKKPQITDHLFKAQENDLTLHFQGCLNEVRILIILLNVKSHQFPQNELDIYIKKGSMIIRQDILYATQILAVENFPLANSCCFSNSFSTIKPFWGQFSQMYTIALLIIYM